MSSPRRFLAHFWISIVVITTGWADTIELNWLGTASTGQIPAAANWLGGVAPTGSGAESLVFGGSGAGTLLLPSGSFTVQNLTFNETPRDAYLFTSVSISTFGLNGNLLVDTPGDVQFDSSVNILLGPSGHTATIAAGSVVRIDGAINGADNTSYIAKAGEGTLVLNGTNLFQSGVSLTGGTLLVGNMSALGTGGIKIYDGATFGPSNNLATYTIGNSIELDCNPAATVIFDTSRSSEFVLSGQITGSATVRKTGLNTLTLSNGSNNFTGDLVVEDGVLQVGASSDLEMGTGPVGSGTLKLNDGTTLRRLEAAGDVTLYNDIELAESGSQNVYIDTEQSSALALLGNISGSSSLTKLGTGYLVLAQRDGGGFAETSDNSFGGGVNVTAGTLILGSSSYVSDGMIFGPVGSGKVTLGDGTALRVAAGISAEYILLHNDIDLAGTGAVTFGTEEGPMTLAGKIAGGAKISKTGSSDLTVTGDNRDLTGDFYISQGRVNFGGQYSAGHGVLELGGPSNPIANFTGANHTIYGLSGDSTSDSVTLGSGTQLVIDQTSDEVYKGAISGDSATSITKSGTGTLALSDSSNNNAYSGTWLINGGTLAVSADNKFGASPASPTPGMITLDGATLRNTADLILNSNRGLSLGTHSSTISTDASTTFTYNGVIAGTSGLTKAGNGTLVLGGANTYQGGTTVAGGTLSVANDGAVGTGNLTLLTGSTLKNDTTGVTLANNVALSGDASVFIGGTHGTWPALIANTLTLSGAITGSGKMTILGSNSLTLGGNNNAWSGGVVIAGNNPVYLKHNNALPGQVAFGATSTGYLELYTMAPTIGSLTGGSANSAIKFETGADGGVLTINQTAGGNFAGAIEGYSGNGANYTGSLVKAGSGTLVLSGASTYTGGTTVNDGDLYVANPSGSGTGTGNITVNNSGGIGIGIGGTAGSISGNIILNGAGTKAGLNRSDNYSYNGTISGTGDLYVIGTGTATLSQANSFVGSTHINAGTLVIGTTNALPTTTAVDLSSAGTLSVANDQTVERILSSAGSSIAIASGKTLTVDFADGATFGSDYQGVLSGAGRLLVAGTASHRIFALAGANTYSGGTEIQSNGALQVGLGGPSGSLGSGAVTNNGVLSFNRNNAHTVANDISGSGKVVNTLGTTTLTGANTYTGGTFINGGVLIAGNSSAFGSGSVTLNGGVLGLGNGVTLSNALTFSSGTTVLGGTGTFGTHITADSHVVLSPGNSPGTLGFAAGLTLDTGSAISFQVQDAAGVAGTAWDLLSVTGGNLDLTASANTITFNVLFLDSGGNAGIPSNFDQNSPYSWTFATSSTAITGFSASQFHLVTEGPTSAYPSNFSVSLSGDSKSLQLNFSPVPEPSTYALLGLGLVTLGLKLRRRRS